MPDTNSTPKVFVKSYFAFSIEEAISRARAELGPDVLLLNTRESPPEARHLGSCEVVVGVKPAAPPAAAIEAATPNLLGDLRQEMAEMRQMLSRLVAEPALRGTRAGVVEDTLVSAGVSPEVAAEIEVAVRERAREGTVTRISGPRVYNGLTCEELASETVSEMESRLNIAPELGRVAALIGPPGAGKTTMLVKLAVVWALSQGRTVRLISIDNHRIAAADQLRKYATILGVPFAVAENPSALAQAISAAPPNAQVLIDTPGLSEAALAERGGEIASFFQTRQDIDTHLVLTASMRAADLRRVVERFESFGPAKLAFTRLDETSSTGAAFSEAARTGKPVSFVSTGQLVPEDLGFATRSRFTAGLVDQLPEFFRAAA